MGTYVFIYHGPTEMPEGATPTEADMKASMDEWMAWAEKAGAALADFGRPLGGGITVTGDGATAASGSDITGYSILDVPSMDAALALAKDHPHLRWPGGCEIEVLEGSTVPGM